MSVSSSSESLRSDSLNETQSTSITQKVEKSSNKLQITLLNHDKDSANITETALDHIPSKVSMASPEAKASEMPLLITLPTSSTEETSIPKKVSLIVQEPVIRERLHTCERELNAALTQRGEIHSILGKVIQSDPTQAKEITERMNPRLIALTEKIKDYETEIAGIKRTLNIPLSTSSTSKTQVPEQTSQPKKPSLLVRSFSIRRGRTEIPLKSQTLTASSSSASSQPTTPSKSDLIIEQGRAIIQLFNQLPIEIRSKKELEKLSIQVTSISKHIADTRNMKKLVKNYNDLEKKPENLKLLSEAIYMLSLQDPHSFPRSDIAGGTGAILRVGCRINDDTVKWLFAYKPLSKQPGGINYEPKVVHDATTIHGTHQAETVGNDAKAVKEKAHFEIGYYFGGADSVEINNAVRANISLFGEENLPTTISDFHELGRCTVMKYCDGTTPLDDQAFQFQGQNEIKDKIMDESSGISGVILDCAAQSAKENLLKKIIKGIIFGGVDENGGGIMIKDMDTEKIQQIMSKIEELASDPTKPTLTISSPEVRSELAKIGIKDLFTEFYDIDGGQCMQKAYKAPEEFNGTSLPQDWFRQMAQGTAFWEKSMLASDKVAIEKLLRQANLNNKQGIQKTLKRIEKHYRSFGQELNAFQKNTFIARAILLNVFVNTPKVPFLAQAARSIEWINDNIERQMQDSRSLLSYREIQQIVFDNLT